MKTRASQTGITAFFCGALAACAPDVEQSGPKHEICESYQQGRPIAILGHSPKFDGEWYADWSYQINRFNQRHSDIPIIPADELSSLDIKDYTLVLAKKGVGEYRLQDRLETPYYDFVMAKLDGEPIEGTLQYFTLEKENPSPLERYCRQ
ncbi:hypothetical protein AB2S62_18150 [Vibrio sp. NTOU-M3]|uniref:hypothetical protein n=1 Tax=Vibrio sp. NTOU-M3 TaxID=3234954 RepID=UPI00349F13E0